MKFTKEHYDAKRKQTGDNNRRIYNLHDRDETLKNIEEYEKAMIKTGPYEELKAKKSFNDRFVFLQSFIKRRGFGTRDDNQKMYKSKRWLDTRTKVLLRDRGCDLGCRYHDIEFWPLIHHIIPIRDWNDPLAFDMSNLITTTQATHNAIHNLQPLWEERRENDTTLWTPRKGRYNGRS